MHKFTLHHQETKANYPKLSALMFAYTIGDKAKISKLDKKAHKNLNLSHLFTPSGLHYSSLYFFMTSLLFFLPYKFKKTLSSVLLILPFVLTGFWSMKRIVLLRVLFMINQKTNLKLSPFYIFLITFFLDYQFGTFSYNPLSFIFSFLFLGIIFSMIDRPKFFWPWAFLGGQVVIALFFETSITTTGFIIGFYITSLFPMVFPIFFLNFLLPDIFSSFSMSLLDLFRNLILSGSELSSELGYISPTLPLLACFIFPKFPFLILFLLSIHSPILN